MCGGGNPARETRYTEARCAILGRDHFTLGRFPWP